MIFTDRIRLLLKVQHKTAKQMLEDLEFNKDQLKIWEGKGIVPKRIFVSAIADYLNTTPEYLRGETDDPSPRINEKDSKNEEELSEQERLIIEKFRAASTEEKFKIITAIVTITNKGKKEKPHLVPGTAIAAYGGGVISDPPVEDDIIT